MRIQFYFHTGRGFNSHTGNSFLFHNAVRSPWTTVRSPPDVTFRIRRYRVADRSAVLRGRSGCATQRSTRSALNLLGPFSHARSAISSFIFHTFSSLVSPGLHLYSTENHYEDIRHPYCCVVCRRLSRGRHPQVRASTSALPPAHKLICLSSTE